MRLIYIAGPFRGANAWEVEQNIRRAEALALEVWKLGAACVCPHTNTRFFDGALPDADFLAGDLEVLGRCDAVLMVEGWEQSRGAVAESVFATDKGIRVFQTLADLSQWIDYGKVDRGVSDYYEAYKRKCAEMRAAYGL